MDKNDMIVEVETENDLKEKRKPKFWDKPLGTILLFLILYIVFIVLMNLISILVNVVGLPMEWEKINYLSVALWGLMFVIFMMLKDKMSLKTMLAGYGNNNIKSVIWGLLAGFACNGILIYIASIAGNVKLSFKGMNVWLGLIAFVMVALQSMGEEIVERVFLYQRFKRSNGPLFAIIVSSVIFALLHVLNLIEFDVEPVYAFFAMLNIVMVGVYLAETVYFGNNVWYAFAFHSAWNYTQSFLFGLPNSGNPATTSVFGLDTEGSNGLFYSAKFGVEATAGATLIFAILIVVTYIVGKKRQKTVEA